MSTDLGEAHLHTAVTEKSKCSATGRLTLAPQRQVGDRQGNWVRHCPHRSESWDARQRLSGVLRQLLKTWDKVPSQMWKPCSPCCPVPGCMHSDRGVPFVSRVNSSQCVAAVTSENVPSFARDLRTCRYSGKVSPCNWWLLRN